MSTPSRHIPIVDDDPLQVRLLGRQLADTGIAVNIEGHTVAAALASLGTPDDPDTLVMLDLNMPDIDGLAFPDAFIPGMQEAGLIDELTRLRQIGVSIDDFGTGHSSLSRLRDLPFDELKIDRGFVTGARKLPARRAIFCGCIDMAHELHIRVVAEGVEDREDWDFVRTSGCDQAQGDFISRPIPAADLPAWHGRWQQRCGELLG
ncbi:EAL domain-containing protein [Thauera aminoaromatica]|jgi:EAL domain-containing protein (putative c-di-GMP-specific phosphodiesterase class I)|uniref:EAL domain-containing protein n=1 Tax=Thauera aminoaromatica TaxID=164330 RepID=A0A5C7S5I2_THASP|nr:EAL domain-containing protein [Thauera aminoaromatica]TXH79148.1 MAG: EAL domain-containing protein [Thauera aminoaromatica]